MKIKRVLELYLILILILSLAAMLTTFRAAAVGYWISTLISSAYCVMIIIDTYKDGGFFLSKKRIKNKFSSILFGVAISFPAVWLLTAKGVIHLVSYPIEVYRTYDVDVTLVGKKRWRRSWSRCNSYVRIKGEDFSLSYCADEREFDLLKRSRNNPYGTISAKLSLWESVLGRRIIGLAAKI